MPPKVYFVSSSLFVLSLKVAGHQHCQQERSNSSVVSLIQLSTFQETLQNQNHWPQLWVFFLEEFNQFYAVNTIGTVERNIEVDVRLFVLELYQRHLGVFEWLN